MRGRPKKFPEMPPTPHLAPFLQQKRSLREGWRDYFRLKTLNPYSIGYQKNRFAWEYGWWLAKLVDVLHAPGRP